MKRFISLLLVLVICLSLSVTVCAAGTEQLVYDDADLLTVSEEARLQEKLRAVSSQCNAQIIVATIDYAGGDLDSYTNAIYDGMGFGYGPNRDGVLLLVCLDIREFRILSNGYAGDAISYHEIDNIEDTIISALSDGDYADAFMKFADQCDYYLQGWSNGFPFDFGTNLLISLAIGLVAGLIVAFVLKGQLKSVRPQNQANDYVRAGSMKLTNRSDIFLYRNVSRTRRQTNSSSGSRSGGSRSMGGGRF